MNKLYLTLFTFMLFVNTLSQAQVFPVETLQWTGDANNRVNLVILGDGYTASEQTKMTTDANNIMTKLFQTSPYKEYKNYFNVILVKVVSNQSGASHPHNSSDNACGSQPTATVDNYFGSTFDGGGGSYHRLLVVTRGSRVNSVLAANFPQYDQCLVMINTPYYGGAGGAIATCSVDASASEIAIHEIGHSFARLADEYQIEQGEAPNRTSNNNPATIKWKNWLNIQGIGIFANGGIWYKPANNNCKMQYLGTNYPFCAVCRESHVNRVQTLTRCYDSYSPSNASTLNVSTDQNFTINTILPIPNTLQVTWTLNGTVISGANNLSSYTLPYSSLVQGGANNTLVATLRDNTSYIRVNTIPTYQITWNIVANTIGGNGDGLTANYFNGMNFETPVYTTKDAALNMNWNNGSPNTAVNADQFSARWTGQVQPRYSGEYTFYITSDNGRRVWVNNQLIIDRWVDDWDIEYSGKITLTAGQKYNIRVDYFENNGGANVKLHWSSASQAKEIIPTSQLYSNPVPTVNITSPANNSSFNAPTNISFNVNAGDNTSVSKVEYYNGSAKIGESANAPFSFTWTNVAAGNYTITARAFDNLNAVKVSGAITVQVKTPTVNVPPTVNLTSPASGARFNAPATVSIAANASDSDGSIARVDFYNGAQLLNQDATTPYSFNWTNVPAGTYTITARAYDNLGANTTSSGVTIVVNPVTSDPCAALPAYAENAGYVAGSKVKNLNRQYECKEWPYSGWCNGAAWAYAPGSGAYWGDAWYDRGACSAKFGAANNAKEQINVVPNPTSGITTVITGGKASVSVFNTQGINVVSTITIDGEGTIDLSELPAGVYMVRIDTNGEVVMKQVVKY